MENTMTKSRTNVVSKIMSSFMIYIVLALLILAVSVMSGGRFLAVTNIECFKAGHDHGNAGHRNDGGSDYRRH